MTEKLERLILQGKARYKTYSQITPSGVIYVPKNTFVVVLKVIVQAGTGIEQRGPSLEKMGAAAMQQLSISSRSGSDNRFTFRADLNNSGNVPGNVDQTTLPVGTQKFSCYDVHSENVNVQLAAHNLNKFNRNLLSTNDRNPADLAVADYPAGYGKGTSGTVTIQRLTQTSSSGDNFQIITVPKNKVDVALTQDIVYTEYKLPFQAETTPYIVSPITTSSTHYAWWAFLKTVINIHYVHVLLPKPKDIL